MHPLSGFIYTEEQVIIAGKNGALHSLKYCKFAKPVNLQFAKLVGFHGDNKQ